MLEGQAAEAVVAAELDDDDLGMAREDELDAVEAVLGGVAADAGVDDVVVVALGVEEALEVVGIGLAEVGAVAGGERVAEADEACAESCADGEGLCVVGCGEVGCGVGDEGTGAACVGEGTEAVVATLLLAGLQPLRERLAAREAKAIKPIPDKLGATRARFTAFILERVLRSVS